MWGWWPGKARTPPGGCGCNTRECPGFSLFPIISAHRVSQHFLLRCPPGLGGPGGGEQEVNPPSWALPLALLPRPPSEKTTPLHPCARVLSGRQMPVIIATSKRERTGPVTAGPHLGCSPRARPCMGAPGQVAYPLCAMVSSSIRPGRSQPLPPMVVVSVAWRFCACCQPYHSEGSRSPENLGWAGTSPPPDPALGTGHLQSLHGTLHAEALQAPPSTPFL